MRTGTDDGYIFLEKVKESFVTSSGKEHNLELLFKEYE